MGAMTLEQFRAELSFTLGDQGPKDNVLIDAWINRAYYELANQHCWELFKESTTVATVADVGAVSMPADAMEIISIADPENKVRLIRSGLSTYHIYNREDTGCPRYYIRQGEEILLHPIPDDAYDLDVIYSREPTTLSASADTTEIAAAFDHAIMLFAVRTGLDALGENERARVTYENAVAYIARQYKPEDYAMQSLKQGIDVAQSHADLHNQR